MSEKNKKVSRFFLDIFPMALSWCVIFIFGVINIAGIISGRIEGNVGLALFKLMPTLFSPIIIMMIAHAKRISFFFASLNSLLYGVNYLIEGLYFSFFTAACISMPVQMYSFICWTRNAKKKGNGEVTMKAFSPKSYPLMLGIIAAAWVVCYFVIGDLIPGQNHRLLDTLSFVFSMSATFLMTARHVEAQYINVASNSIGTTMWVLIAMNDMSRFNYVVNTVYNLYVALRGSVIWTKKYREESD
ncbi:MAG: nicotinamide mononucleotide transporter [Clostridia bacterium]|nr:nicotinamide mononucleotide transporter [Clostridia bacterium]